MKAGMHVKTVKGLCSCRTFCSKNVLRHSDNMKDGKDSAHQRPKP